MSQRELEKEGVDLKLVLLLLLKKISRVIIAALAGAVVCGGIYAVWHGMLMDKRQYEAQSKYYITFEETMEKSYLDYYYNGYTWNDLLSSDPVLGYAMTLLPEGYDRSYVDDCVEAEILSDVRVLTTTVKADTSEEVLLIQEALEEAVVHYGTVGDKLEQIMVIRSDEPQLESITNAIVRATATGAVVFAVLMTLLLLFGIAVEDGIYLPEEFVRRFQIPVAGVRFGRKARAELQEQFAGELAENLSYLTDGKEYCEISVQEVQEADREMFAKWRALSGVVVRFSQQESSRKLTHVLERLKLQDCVVLAAIMVDADVALVARYYGI